MACDVRYLGNFVSGIVDVELKEGDDVEPYTFDSEKNLFINSRCRRVVTTNKVERALVLATKNYLYEIKQHTSTHDSVADVEMKKQRCLKEIYPDGNCLFRALSYCMFRDESNYRSIREKIVKEVVEHWNEYSAFMVGGNIYEKDITSADEYKNYMSADGIYGAEYELKAASDAYGICLQVYTSIDRFYRMGDEKNKIYALYYSGDGFHGHYQPVEDVPLAGLAEPTEFTIQEILNIQIDVAPLRTLTDTGSKENWSIDHFRHAQADMNLEPSQDPLISNKINVAPSKNLTTSFVTNTAENWSNGNFRRAQVEINSVSSQNLSAFDTSKTMKNSPIEKFPSREVETNATPTFKILSFLNPSNKERKLKSQESATIARNQLMPLGPEPPSKHRPIVQNLNWLQLSRQSPSPSAIRKTRTTMKSDRKNLDSIRPRSPNTYDEFRHVEIL